MLNVVSTTTAYRLLADVPAGLHLDKRVHRELVSNGNLSNSLGM